MKLFELTEGLFKLPPDTSMEILNGVMYAGLTKYQSEFSSTNIKQLITSLIQQYPQPSEYNEEHQIFTVTMPQYSLPPKLQSHMRKKGIPIVIQPNDVFPSSWDVRDQIMKINFRCIYQALMQSDPKLAMIGAIEKIKTTIVHEFTHAYQQIIAKVDPRYDAEKSNYTNSGPEYFKSRIEFDPQIKSTIGFYYQLKALVVDSDWIMDLIHLIISGRYTGDEIGQLIDRQLNDDSTAQKGFRLLKSYKATAMNLTNFYYHIKHQSPQKWKRAVKYLMIQIR